jgi:hypothetical protein
MCVIYVLSRFRAIQVSSLVQQDEENSHTFPWLGLPVPISVKTVEPYQLVKNLKFWMQPNLTTLKAIQKQNRSKLLNCIGSCTGMYLQRPVKSGQHQSAKSK